MAMSLDRIIEEQILRDDHEEMMINENDELLEIFSVISQRVYQSLIICHLLFSLLLSERANSKRYF